MNNFYKGAILSAISALGYALLPVFALFAYRGNISVSTLLFFRFIFAAIILFGYILFKYRKISIKKKDLLFLFILGGICYNLQARCYFTSVKYIPAALTSLILYTYPMLVTILSAIFDKEQVTLKIGSAIGISFIGLILILGTSFQSLSGLGVILAFGSALVYSIYIVIGNRVLKSTEPLLATASITLFSSIGVLTSGLLMKDVGFHFKAGAWLPIMGLVLFSTVLAMLFFFKGMELIGPSRASIISMLEPLFTVILMTLIFRDNLTIFQLVGGFIVLASSILVVKTQTQTQSKEQVSITKDNDYIV